GVNPDAPNDISVEVPIGSISLDPIGEHDSLLSSSNPFYVLGSMPQDDLTVGVATSTTVGPHHATGSRVLAFGVDFFLADAYYLATVPPNTYPLIGATYFPDANTVIFPQQYYYTTWPELATGPLPYSFYSPATGGGLGFNQIYLRPGANY